MHVNLVTLKIVVQNLKNGAFFLKDKKKFERSEQKRYFKCLKCL